MGTASFLGVESGRGVTLTVHPLLLPRSKKQSRAITLLSLRAFMAYEKGGTYLYPEVKHTFREIFIISASDTQTSIPYYFLSFPTGTSRNSRSVNSSNQSLY
jgi:hypothetical protein